MPWTHYNSDDFRSGAMADLTETVLVRLTKPEKQALADLANSLDRPLAWVVRKAIQDRLDYRSTGG